MEPANSGAKRDRELDPSPFSIAQKRRLRVKAAVLLAAGVTALLAVAAVAYVKGAREVGAASTIETTYAATGSWAVSTGSATDAAGGSYTLFYPTNLGAGGFQHPILTWGNGTGATPSQYANTLNHLASWGFVVIASNSGQTGLGTEMLAGANYVVAQNSNASSIFYQKLNTAKVGALGHSQGAGGTLNATINSNGLIVSAFTYALPDPFWWTTPLPNLANLHASIFFVRGSLDVIATEGSAQNWYNQVSGEVAKASLLGADHLNIQWNQNGLQGYLTAWMMYTLQGDSVARGAFVGNPPEIYTNAGWWDQAVSGLRPLCSLFDLDNNGSVGFPDLLIFAQAYNSTPSSFNWNPAADLDGGGDVGFADLLLFARHYNQTC